MFEGDKSKMFSPDDKVTGGAQETETVTQYYRESIGKADSLVYLNTVVINIDQAAQDGHISPDQVEDLYSLVDQKITDLGVSRTELQKNAKHYLGFIGSTFDKPAIEGSLGKATEACIKGEITGRDYLEIKASAESRLSLNN